ncbi:MAG: phosphatase [Christensenellales bacterium]|jgi:exopolyphosphatase/guanosine-5'-triphosphate,3'-diphosphate pyrophosphatase
MRKKNPGKVVSVIDIGSNMLRMRISQLAEKDILHLDVLERPVKVGHEVFLSGRISMESVLGISAHLKGFSQLMREYGCKQYAAVATTAFREAENQILVVDHIKILNHISLEVLDEGEETTLIYFEMLKQLQQCKELDCGSALLCYIGTGSLGVALYDGEQIIATRSIPLGSLKISEMLRGLQDKTPEFHTVLEEFLSSFIKRLKVHISYIDVKNLVVAGKAIDQIVRFCGGTEEEAGSDLLSKERLFDVYREVHRLSPLQISMAYGMNQDQAEVFYTLMAIFVKIAELCSERRILAPKIELWDGLAKQMLDSEYRQEYREHVQQNAISSALTMAKRYCCDMQHVQRVGDYACLLFDKTKRHHGLKGSYRTLLHLAALLHDCGHFTNTKDHRSSTLDLIKNSYLYGLRDEEIELIARITAYDQKSRASFTTYRGEAAATEMAVAKLSALLWLANTLDKSHKGKISQLKVRVQDRMLNISATSDSNLMLENWAFDECVPFFEDVLGLRPQLNVRTVLL